MSQIKISLIILFQSTPHIYFHLMTVHYSIQHDWLACHQERLKTSLGLLDTNFSSIAKNVERCTNTNMIHGCWNLIYTELSFTLTQQHPHIQETVITWMFRSKGFPKLLLKLPTCDQRAKLGGNYHNKRGKKVLKHNFNWKY